MRLIAGAVAVVLSYGIFKVTKIKINFKIKIRANLSFLDLTFVNEAFKFNFTDLLYELILFTYNLDD